MFSRLLCQKFWNNVFMTLKNKPETQQPKREYQFSLEEIARQTIHAFHEAKNERLKLETQKAKEQLLLDQKEAMKILETFPKLLKEAILKGENEVVLHRAIKEQYQMCPIRNDSFQPVAKGSLALLETYFKKEEFCGFKTNLIAGYDNTDIKFVVTWDTSKIKH